MYIANYSRRTKAVFLLSFVFFAFALLRLLYIQFFRSSYLEEIAAKQHNCFMELEPRRGTIFDRNLNPQAVNLPCDSVFASPIEMKDDDKESVMRQVMETLKLDHSFLKNRFSRRKSFVWLARKVNQNQAEALRVLKLKGIGFVKESKRCYPNSYLTSQIIGFAGLDNVGLEGMELYYDRYLRGKAGNAIVLRDARSTKLDIYGKTEMPEDGKDIVLTIDEMVQYIAERELDKAFRSSRAKGATIVVMDPKTGQILAMASRPTFDCNAYKGVNKEQIRNRAICDMFEPGSVFKIVTAAAVIEEGKFSEQDKIFCENGEWHYGNGKRSLHDHTAHGWLTFQEVIENSSNIGTCKAAVKLGAQRMYKYIKAFGFGQKTGIEFPGEINGIVPDIKNWSGASIYNIPMGQGIGVSAIQLAGALSVIANGGTLMKPYIVMEIRDKSGKIEKAYSPTPVRTVISSDTAARVRKILVGVIENGTGKLAKSQEFTAGGKTGTAQKIESNGTYSHSKFNASFVGFAPAEDPQVVIAVIIDEPRGFYYGGVISAPVFKNVAGDVLKYLKSRQELQSE
ncbi:MAG: peptidoglycan D,D-transpeptidase FtsI family protein [Deltaproteobacteria bacterium]